MCASDRLGSAERLRRRNQQEDRTTLFPEPHTDPAMTDRLLHFTLGSVQSFVAQARRTRDLWAGSFLLSWLAGRAMRVIVENGGSILVPDVKQDPLFVAV